MFKKNLIAMAIMSLALFFTTDAFGQTGRQKAKLKTASVKLPPNTAWRIFATNEYRSRNKTSRSSRSRIPRGRTQSRIIMANTEGDFHIKAKTRRVKRN